jgi:hypothetical protein
LITELRNIFQGSTLDQGIKNRIAEIIVELYRHKDTGLLKDSLIDELVKIKNQVSQNVELQNTALGELLRIGD